MMRKCFFTLALLLLPFAILAAQRPTSGPHFDLSGLIDASIDWATHLKTETSKGNKIDPAKFEKEIVGMGIILESLDTFTNKFLADSPHEQHEGHFTNMLQAQAKAKVALAELKSAFAGKDYWKMNKAAKNISAHLQNAHYWHELELYEIENPSSEIK